MSENSYSFRTAVGGFHKGDVAAYIASTAAEHKAQLDALTAQIQQLETENDRLRQQIPAASALPNGDECPPEAEISAAAQRQEAEDSLREMELAAYRRAEAAERLASGRAKKLYMQLQAVCDTSSQQFLETDAAAQAAAAAIDAQLQALRQSFEALRVTVGDAFASLETMDSMIPDPAEGMEGL